MSSRRNAAQILSANRTSPFVGGASFSLSNRIERLVWRIAWLIFARWTPPMFSPWRIWLLKRFGAQVAPGAKIAASTKVWFARNLVLGQNAALGPGVECYTQATITIGARVVVSQRSYLCAGSHDIRDRNFQLIAKSITICDDAWIAAEAFVGPGVQIGEGAVLGARGCAFDRLDAWTVYRGNPAQRVGERQFEGRSREVPSISQKEEAGS